MQTNFHLYPPEYDRTTKQPMKDFGFIESLKIDSMVVLIKESYRGFADLSLENYFSTDEQVLDYRLGVVEDLVNNPNLYETFGKAVSMIYNINDMRRAMSSEFTIDSSLRSVRYLKLYAKSAAGIATYKELGISSSAVNVGASSSAKASKKPTNAQLK